MLIASNLYLQLVSMQLLPSPAHPPRCMRNHKLDAKVLGAEVSGAIKPDSDKPAPGMPAAELPKPKVPHPEVPDADKQEAEVPDHEAPNHEVLDPKVPDAHEPGADEPGANDRGPSSPPRPLNPHRLEVPCRAIPLALLHRGTALSPRPLPPSGATSLLHTLPPGGTKLFPRRLRKPLTDDCCDAPAGRLLCIFSVPLAYTSI